MIHPALLSMSVPDPSQIVLAGYQDCAEEAIRYLLEVEHLSEDNPLVVGLKQHLWERQMALDIERLLLEHAAQQRQALLQQQYAAACSRQESMSANRSIFQESQEPDAFRHTGSADVTWSATAQTRVTPDLCDANEMDTEQPGLHTNQPPYSENDKAIAALTHELLALLEEDEGYSDDESDDEIEQ